MSAVRMGERGQITIPKDIRDKLGLQPKAVLDVTMDGNIIHIHKPSEGAKRVAAIRGIADLKYAGSVDEYIEEIRGR
jgi:AbrB family looped-hinge helix DNA binding protein